MYKCAPREIIDTVPGVQTVRLPSYWFDDLKQDRSVFTSLYEWMLEENRIPSEDKQSLHNRTYVSEKIAKKLFAAEKNRLQKSKKVPKGELDEAVAWSDLDTGPKYEIGGCKISGDVILVIPSSSKFALNELHSSIRKKCHDLTVNKIRNSAAGANFYGWMLSQLDRPDRVGDLARDAEQTENFPRDSLYYEEIKLFMESIGACGGAIESLKEGWLEYAQQYPDRILPSSWCDDCGKQIDTGSSVLAWSYEYEEFYILDTDCRNKRLKYEEMTSWPLDGFDYPKLESLGEMLEASEMDMEKIIETLKLWGILPVTVKGTIYFIRAEATQEIKIGFTGGDVSKRIAALQTGHPRKLSLITTVPGFFGYEKALHKRFDHIRLNGEWFEPHPDLLTFIDSIQNILEA